MNKTNKLLRYYFVTQVDSGSMITLAASAHMGKGNLKSKILNTAYINGGTQVSLALEEALKMFNNEGIGWPTLQIDLK